MELVSRCCWQPRPPLSARLSPDMASSRDSVQSDSFPQSPQPSASPEMETEWSVNIIIITIIAREVPPGLMTFSIHVGNRSIFEVGGGGSIHNTQFYNTKKI